MQEFVIDRIFAAPREVVFRAFTESARMKQWWGPKGFSVLKSDIDLKPGGIHHYLLKGPDGALIWGKFLYREIVAPERIVWLNSFSDEAGGTTRHPMMPTWPLEMHSTALFETVGEADTRFTIKWTPHNANPIKAATFAAGHASMTMGWNGTFDQLAEYLKGAAA